jgi:hypothetical protein
MIAKQKQRKAFNNGFRIIWWMYLETVSTLTILTITIKFGYIGLMVTIVLAYAVYKLINSIKWQSSIYPGLVINYIKLSSNILAEITGKIVFTIYSYVYARTKQFIHSPKTLINTQRI